MDIDRLVMEVSMFPVVHGLLDMPTSFLLQGALVTEGPVVLDRHYLIQCLVIHQEDFLICEAEVIF